MSGQMYKEAIGLEFLGVKLTLHLKQNVYIHIIAKEAGKMVSFLYCTRNKKKYDGNWQIKYLSSTGLNKKKMIPHNFIEIIKKIRLKKISLKGHTTEKKKQPLF